MAASKAAKLVEMMAAQKGQREVVEKADLSVVKSVSETAWRSVVK